MNEASEGGVGQTRPASRHVPPEVRGVWRRVELSAPNGVLDVTTEVVWLQTRRLYADIRIPADRPARPGAVSFDAYSEDELVRLAAMEGFAGALHVDRDICLWRRDLDFQPPSPVPDEARFVRDGATLTELGVHAEYTEVWIQEAGDTAHLAAFVGVESREEMLVIAGDHFIEIVPRAVPLPVGQDLAAIVRRDLADGRRSLANERLDMRIAYGRIAGAGQPWRILRSTLPWLEGLGLFPEGARFDPSEGLLFTPGRSTRKLEDASGGADALVGIFKVPWV